MAASCSGAGSTTPGFGPGQKTAGGTGSRAGRNAGRSMGVQAHRLGSGQGLLGLDAEGWMGVLAHSTDGRRWRPGRGGRCRAGVVPRAAGRDIDDAALAHIWPARHENFYFHGTHSVNVDSELAKLDADGTGRCAPPPPRRPRERRTCPAMCRARVREGIPLRAYGCRCQGCGRRCRLPGITEIRPWPSMRCRGTGQVRPRAWESADT